jgi:hypothetical protein
MISQQEESSSEVDSSEDELDQPSEDYGILEEASNFEVEDEFEDEFEESLEEDDKLKDAD